MLDLKREYPTAKSLARDLSNIDNIKFLQNSSDEMYESILDNIGTKLWNEFCNHIDDYVYSAIKSL